jgi:hypothetical protein
MSEFLSLLYTHLAAWSYEPQVRLCLDRTIRARGIVGNHYSWEGAR